MGRYSEIKQNFGSWIPFLTTFIKKIQLSNDKNQKVVLIDNFARVAQTKNLVFDFIEMRSRFNATGQGRVQKITTGKRLKIRGITETLRSGRRKPCCVLDPFKNTILIFKGIICLFSKVSGLVILIRLTLRFQSKFAVILFTVSGILCRVHRQSLSDLSYDSLAIR